jgi:hypothetical protein
MKKDLINPCDAESAAAGGVFPGAAPLAVAADAACLEELPSSPAGAFLGAAARWAVALIIFLKSMDPALGLGGFI